ncbi:MAG: hypothetical protein KJ063_02315 [Anaerolineae bacterium]|nr:hypothetical protein [Anaerolineae bacterium]
MKQQFLEFRFRAETLKRIDMANQIIRGYLAQGYRLTLRQLYYQHVARGLIENSERSYKQMGELINNGRLSGLIDWSAIEDRTRNLRGIYHRDDPAEAIQDAYRDFRLDKWENQPNRVEVWVEKDALVGILSRVCSRNDVNFFACRGYVSQSEMYDAARRVARYIRAGQDVTILHLGDHDPSGIDMSRDIRDRMVMFLEGLGVYVNRLALNWEQIELYTPPPNPAKTTDSRFNSYAEQFGHESWELDALEPAVIDELIEENILALRDDSLWDEKREEEETYRQLLQETSERWADVVRYLQQDEE